MEDLELLIKEIIIWKYVILVIAAGAFFARDGVLQPLPARIRLILLKVNAFWRVAIISAVLAILYYKLSTDVDMINLIISYAFANLIYEGGVKKIIPHKKK